MVSKRLTTSSVTERVAELGSARWLVHYEARRRISAGEDIIELTIGEPDVPTPPPLIEAAHQAMLAGRTGYASGKGEDGLLQALSEKYTKRTGRPITAANLLAFPGTQAALTLCLMAMAEAGDAVLVPDPYYATYEGVVRATGAEFVPVPMQAGKRVSFDRRPIAAGHGARCKSIAAEFPAQSDGCCIEC